MLNITGKQPVTPVICTLVYLSQRYFQMHIYVELKFCISKKRRIRCETQMSVLDVSISYEIF